MNKVRKMALIRAELITESIQAINGLIDALSEIGEDDEDDVNNLIKLREDLIEARDKQ